VSFGHITNLLPFIKMKSFKKVLRLIGLGLLIILALTGVGITGASPIFLKKNEQDYDHEIKTELVEGHQDAIEEKDVE
jgi:hypothetical protein